VFGIADILDQNLPGQAETVVIDVVLVYPAFTAGITAKFWAGTLIMITV